MTRHVYFDLDGTLTDPFEGISRCILYAVSELGCPRPSIRRLKDCIGPPLAESMPGLVGRELTPRAIELYRERFNEVGWRENVPYPGIDDALASIAADGCELFVATSKPRIAAQRIVDHFGLGSYFGEVFGSEPDGTRADKSDLLRYAIDRNTAASQRVMIGDRRHDLVGAAANGITSVGVLYGYGSALELEDAAAIAASPHELPDVIGRVLAMLD